MTADREALQEALVGELKFIYGADSRPEATAEALIYGPLAEVLAENERLRGALVNREATLKERISDRDRITFDIMAERDQLRATLDAVRGGSVMADEYTLALRRHTVMTGPRFDEVLAAHDAQVRAEAAEWIAQAIHAAKPRHFTRDYTPVDQAYDHCARIARAGGERDE